MEVFYYILIATAIIFGVCCLLSFHMVSQLEADSYSSASSAEILRLVLSFGILFSFLPILIAFKAFKIGRKRTTKIMAKNVPVVIKLCEPLAIQISEAMWPTPHSWEPLRQSSQARPDPRFAAPVVSAAAPASKGAALSIPAPIRLAISILLYALAVPFGLFALYFLASCIQMRDFGGLVFSVPAAAVAFGLVMAGNFFRAAAPASKGAALLAISVLLYVLAAPPALFALFALLDRHPEPAQFVPAAAVAFGLFKAGGFVRKKGATVIVAPPRAN